MGRVIGTWSDIQDGIRVLDEGLVYVDAPLEGFAELRATGERHAFRCREVVRNLLWHWELVPAKQTESVEEVFVRAADDPAAPWISITEDRRAPEPVVIAVEIATAEARPTA